MSDEKQGFTWAMVDAVRRCAEQRYYQLAQLEDPVREMARGQVELAQEAARRMEHTLPPRIEYRATDELRLIVLTELVNILRDPAMRTELGGIAMQEVRVEIEKALAEQGGEAILKRIREVAAKEANRDGSGFVGAN